MDKGVMYLTAFEAVQNSLTPIEVYDARGRIIRRMISSFDTETGVVVSFVLNAKGRPYEKAGAAERRTERFKTPLTYKTNVANINKEYWDLINLDYSI